MATSFTGTPMGIPEIREWTQGFELCLECRVTKKKGTPCQNRTCYKFGKPVIHPPPQEPIRCEASPENTALYAAYREAGVQWVR